MSESNDRIKISATPPNGSDLSTSSANSTSLNGSASSNSPTTVNGPTVAKSSTTENGSATTSASFAKSPTIELPQATRPGTNPPGIRRSQDNAVYLRREVLIRMAKLYFNRRLVESVERIPLEMRPKYSKAIFRCCIYRERAILRQRLIAALGFRNEDDQDEQPLKTYATAALERQTPTPPVLTVVDIACQGCPSARFFVTELCQGCLARHCITHCAFGAISCDEDGRAIIDPTKCKKCGRCREACPYSAITQLRVPCEEACPVAAIHKNEAGIAEIDFEKCTGCGRCMRRCPFAAIMERSQILDVLRAIDASHDRPYVSQSMESVESQETPRETTSQNIPVVSPEISDRSDATSTGTACSTDIPCAADASCSKVKSEEISKCPDTPKRPVVAMVAPAIVGQFPYAYPKIFGAMRALGFDDVFEVAIGADVTAEREAKEFVERMERGERFMTTSCCPAYIETVRRHLPELRPFVSDTATPMHYAAELVRQKTPNAIVVFIGPCVAKRFEAMRDPLVDFVLTFEELGTLFVAAGIEVSDCEDYMPEAGSPFGRNFAITSGVAAAVQNAKHGIVVKNSADMEKTDVSLTEISVSEQEVRPICVNGLSPAAIRDLRLYATKTCPGNLVEVMACEGGCVGGAGTLGSPKAATREIRKLAAPTSSPKS